MIEKIDNKQAAEELAAFVESMRIAKARREMAIEIVGRLEAARKPYVDSCLSGSTEFNDGINRAIHIVMSIKPQNIDTSPGYVDGVDVGRE